MIRRSSVKPSPAVGDAENSSQPIGGTPTTKQSYDLRTQINGKVP